MSTIKCVVIDDELPAIEVLEEFINRSSELELIGSATDPFKGVEMIREKQPDVVFLDVQMQELSGLDVKQLIGKDTLTVFCTAFSEYAIQSYELNAVDYLIKPVHHKRFLQTIDKIIERVLLKKPDQEENDGYIIIKTGHKGKVIKLDLDEIDYVEAFRNYVAFYRGKQKTLSYNSLKEVEEKLPKKMFARVHKSFIVSVKQISAVEYGAILLKNSVRQIPIGNNYKSLLSERWKDKFIAWIPYLYLFIKLSLACHGEHFMTATKLA